MEVESIAISSLVFDPSNARKHSEKNLAAIKGSLAKFGQQKPIVVDKNGVVVAGNGTLAAAKELGWAEINAVRTELSGPEAIAFAIADNRTAELAEWDGDILGKALAALKDEMDLSEIGFDDEDLAQWLKDQEKIAGCDEDEVPEQVEAKTKPGDLYILGNHRLLCGDSTNVQHVERLMGGEKADMVFTDPPYGIDEQTDRAFAARSRKAKGNTFKKIAGDESIDCAVGAIDILLGLDIPLMVIWGGNYFCHSLEQTGNWLVWDKREDDKERDFNSDCELAWSRHPNRRSVRIFRHKWKGMIKASEHGQARVHPTQKPIALAEWAFNELGQKTKSVLDLFLGSGSTLIACEKTSRRCYGMEIDPHYCDVVVARWEKYTGLKATLTSG